MGRPGCSCAASDPGRRSHRPEDTGQQQAASTLDPEGEVAMIEFQPEDRVARIIDRVLIGAAMVSLTFGLATGLWGLLQ